MMMGSMPVDTVDYQFTEDVVIKMRSPEVSLECSCLATGL